MLPFHYIHFISLQTANKMPLSLRKLVFYELIPEPDFPEIAYTQFIDYVQFHYLRSC